MQHEVTIFHRRVLVSMFMLLFIATAYSQEMPAGVFIARVPHPVDFGVYEEHRLEFREDSVAIYSRFLNGKSGHCDSIFPATVQPGHEVTYLDFPDRESWRFSFRRDEGYEVLQRDDGLTFFRITGPVPENPGFVPGRKKKSRKRQRCPKF